MEKHPPRKLLDRGRDVSNPGMFFDPFRGQRHVKVTDTRTRPECAEAMRELSDEIHPEA